MRPVLVLAAWRPELAPLLAALRRLRAAEGAEGKDAPPPVSCRAVGVGAVEAAVGAARAIVATRPRAVILVGTAGVYPAAGVGSIAVGTAAVARTLRLVSTAVLRGEGYLPPPLPIHARTDRALLRALARAGAVAADVACPAAVTRARALGRRIARDTGAQIETLEAFAVGRAAQAAGAPFAAVLGVSNRVGPDAHTEWRAHRRAAEAAACAVVLAWLRAPSRR